MEFEIKCMYPRRVNTDLIQYLPQVCYAGEIVLVETDEVLDAALVEISKEKILGFDTETRPNFTKGKNYPVSILQFGGEKKVWIIRLEPLKERLADIYKILENPSIKKAGIAVQGDIKSLRARCHFNPAGFVDVSDYTSNLGVINTGMRNLTALIFGEKISKSAQLTNWASDALTPKQIQYAATDAWISRRLFLEIKKVIEENRVVIEPEPEPESESKRFNLRAFVKLTIKKIFDALGGKTGGSEPSDLKRRTKKQSARSGRACSSILQPACRHAKKSVVSSSEQSGLPGSRPSSVKVVMKPKRRYKSEKACGE